VAAEKSAPPARAGTVTRYTTERIEGEIDAPGPGVVVLNEFMYKGWQVFVDDRPAVPLTVDLCLRGVLVGTGKHRVRWQYSPPHWSLLIGLWLAGFAAIALLATRMSACSGDR
jgi:hypothetical protein